MKKKKVIVAILFFSLLFSSELIFLSKDIFAASNGQSILNKQKFDYVNIQWFEKFKDPFLKGYILRSLDKNHDLKIASLRVKEFKANIEESFGKELPYISINPNYMRLHITKNLFPEGSGMDTIDNNVFIMPLTANYELDLFQKNRQSTLAAKKEFEAVQYNEKAAFIALSSMVTTTYFNIIKTDKIIELQNDIIGYRKNILEITKARNDEGLSPTSDVVMSEKSLTEAESTLKDLQKQRDIFLNQLSVLIGESVDNSTELKRGSIEEIEPIINLPYIVQSDLVAERPDILKAEALLKKSQIDVSVARKDFLPSISISGEFGFASGKFKKLFNWESYLASLSTGLVQSLFAGGQKKARLKAKKYKYEQMFESYQQTILVAFQEVNDSLVSLKSSSDKNNDNLQRLNLGNQLIDIVKSRYQNGDISYFETLQYLELLTWLKIEQIQTKTDYLIDSLSLYKSLAGNIQ